MVRTYYIVHTCSSDKYFGKKSSRMMVLKNLGQCDKSEFIKDGSGRPLWESDI